MITIEDLEKEVLELKARNERVERDKAWETSFARKVTIFLLTYAVIVLFFFVADLPNPFINSLVPAIGFGLSTLTIPFFKKAWVTKHQKK
ncbi:MAG: hypothetical protein O2877_02685 [bacterium]|nr:hypothetical protein [bacterium]